MWNHIVGLSVVPTMTRIDSALFMWKHSVGLSVVPTVTRIDSALFMWKHSVGLSVVPTVTRIDSALSMWKHSVGLGVVLDSDEERPGGRPLCAKPADGEADEGETEDESNCGAEGE